MAESDGGTPSAIPLAPLATARTCSRRAARLRHAAPALQLIVRSVRLTRGTTDRSKMRMMLRRDAAPLDRLPRIRDLYRRHSGLTRALSFGYEEAAAVSLAETCSPPTPFVVWARDAARTRILDWSSPSIRQRRAWANDIDRTAAAAYGLALAAVEVEFGLVAVARTSTLSGADYYVARPGESDYLENAFRLEVSGTSSSASGRVNERIKNKAAQVYRVGDPSLACVVSFGAFRIIIKVVQ